MSEQTYTYRNGKKIALKKMPNEFVVRASPEELRRLGIDDAERVSSASSRVRSRSDRLEPLMSSSRNVAPTHHAYRSMETGADFLITDRIMVRFKEPPSDEQLAEITGRYGLTMMERFTEVDFLLQLTDQIVAFAYSYEGGSSCLRGCCS